ncbi:hypothetical protein ACOMHN_000929 [Nucella lapillus]
MPRLIKATILTGQGKGDEVLIPRIPLHPSDSQVEFQRLQFPVRLSFAMTINTSQGQSLKIVGLNLKNDVFSHGQLYVGCSRVGDGNNLFVMANTKYVKNVVYKEALK